MAAFPPSAADWSAQAAALAAAEAQILALQQQLAQAVAPAASPLVPVAAAELAELRLLARIPQHNPSPVFLLAATGEVLHGPPDQIRPP